MEQIIYYFDDIAKCRKNEENSHGKTNSKNFQK